MARRKLLCGVSCQARRWKRPLDRREGTDRAPAPERVLCGAIYEITDRKALEARLLALNETLEARVAEVRQEARNLEILNATGVAIAAERNLAALVQTVTDAGVQLSHA